MVWRGLGDIALEDVPDARVREPTDAEPEAVSSTGVVDPDAFVTQRAEPTGAVQAHETFDRREEGWLETVLDMA